MIAEERKCLNALSATSQPDGERCVPFITIQNITGFDRRLVRVCVRRLARKGLAEYFRALWSDDGLPAGAGYCITKEGQVFLKDQPYRYRKVLST